MKKSRQDKVSRRSFLLKGGAAAAAALAATVTAAMAADKPKKRAGKKTTAPASPAAPVPQSPPSEKPETLDRIDITITLNGVRRSITVPAGRTLAEVLREECGLRGVKIGCGSAECGACTVLLNSRPVYSCSMLAVLADQAWIETIEGIGQADGPLHPLQASFIENDAMQCGYCTPGMICASKALLTRHPSATEEQIRDGLAGNLCRCGAYKNIVSAVAAVAKK